MDQENVRAIMSGQAAGVGPTLLRAGLQVAAGPYWAAMWLRRKLYRRGLLKRHRVGVAVICVGNLTTGGTGKTPMVIWVVNKLQAMGRRPAVLSRGYKAGAAGSDEARLIEQVTGATVVVNPDRCAGASRAIDLGADVLVMDDGFSHLKLARDLDIVLIDATNPFGYGHVLPRGMAREPLGSLAEADEVIITRSDQAQPTDLEETTRRLERLTGGKAIHWAQHRPAAVIDPDGARHDPETLAGRRVYAFAGIARPDRFFGTLGQLGARVVGEQGFDDHADLSAGEVTALNQAAELSPAEVLITTEKDYARLDPSRFSMGIWRLAIEMDLLDAEDKLIDRLRRCVRAGGRHKPWRGDIQQ
jgi:tetraacyldisaccharide 4'-kinase